ncbi:superinfection immunity protein [Granulosicoccaceae sp. 1_MG-2023]|nr:superinfection immunity protein [Granulosicoccaceae sp. 1_MG-2023]
MELILVPLLLAAYFLPTMIAVRVKHGNCDAVFLTNLFLAWTGLGWIALLIWAFYGAREVPADGPADGDAPN